MNPRADAIERLMNPAPRGDADTITVDRATFRRVLRDEALTVTGTGRGDEVFDELARSVVSTAAARRKAEVITAAVDAIEGEPGESVSAAVRAHLAALYDAAAAGAAARPPAGGTCASHVVVDTHDGYTFWRGADGEMFDAASAAAFAAVRNAEMKPEHQLYRVFALTPAG